MSVILPLVWGLDIERDDLVFLLDVGNLGIVSFLFRVPAYVLPGPNPALVLLFASVESELICGILSELHPNLPAGRSHNPNRISPCNK